MDACSHHNLVQLPKPGNKLRCRHCHLTIKADELRQDFCPECFDKNGDKRYDFETIDAEEPAITQYRCEDCGVIIENK
jgi:predicted RNA-binding Zn-ribbon protein involved in translation (DUF1610 family)